jgi:hypothetical protein
MIFFLVRNVVVDFEKNEDENKINSMKNRKSELNGIKKI